MSLKDMVESQIAARGICNRLVLDACGKVCRELFVPSSLQPNAYADTPLPIGCGQTISQPYIVALMTEMLDPDPSYRILEIGTGSGYQTAILAEIFREVYTVEIIPELAERARHILRQCGYTNIHFSNGDGAFGWPEFAPYDSIIVTAAAPVIPMELSEQLKQEGRMVIPVGMPDTIQMLYTITRTAKGFIEEPGIPVRFVPMTGSMDTGE